MPFVEIGITPSPLVFLFVNLMDLCRYDLACEVPGSYSVRVRFRTGMKVRSHGMVNSTGST